MKLKAKKEDHDLMGLEKEAKEFSIDTDSHMIVSILRDKLYKNKVAAVCREIASNGRDANREAGRKDVPVVITISEDNDLIGEGTTSISFRDSGVGITPERMDKIFLKYGGSTKRGTNKQTGGFGIGAKTPFAYTNNFLITTVAEIDGKKIEYIYQALIIADGVRESSKLMLISEEETDAHTGTTITVPIGDHNSDFNLADRIGEFEYECIHATATWAVRPTCVGFKQYSRVVDTKNYGLETILKAGGWEILKDTNNVLSARGKIVAAVDGIPYQIDADEIKDRRFAEKLKNFFPYYSNDFIPVLKLKTGSISLSASREDVEYIPENLETLITAYEKMKADVQKQAKKILDDAGSVIEKSTLFNKINNGVRGDAKTKLDKTCSTLHYALGDLKENLVKEENLLTRLNQMCPGHTFVKTSVSDFTIQQNVSTLSVDIQSLKSTPIYYRNINSDSRRNSTIKKENDGSTHIILVMPKKDGRIYKSGEAVDNAKAKLEELLAEAGLPFQNYDEVEKDKSITYTRSKANKEHKNSVNVSVREFVNSGYGSPWESKVVECNKKEGTICSSEIDGHSKDKIIVLKLNVDSITTLNAKCNAYNSTYLGLSLPDYLEKLKGRYWSSKGIVPVMLKHLKEKGYLILATTKPDYFKGEKDIIKNKKMTKVFEKEYFDEDFKKGLKDYVDYMNSCEFEIEDHLQEIYLNNPEFLKLGGLNLEDLEKAKEVSELDKTDECKLVETWTDASIEVLHEKFKLDKKDFGVKLTVADIENAMSKIKKEQPLLHFLFDKIEDSYGLEEYSPNYDVNAYRSYETRQAWASEGRDILMKQVKEILKVELEKLDKKKK